MSHWWGQEQECLQTRGRGPMAWGATVAPWSGLVGWWMRRWGKACWILLASVGSLLGRKGLNLNGKMYHLIYIIFLWDWKHLRLFGTLFALQSPLKCKEPKTRWTNSGWNVPRTTVLFVISGTFAKGWHGLLLLGQHVTWIQVYQHKNFPFSFAQKVMPNLCTFSGYHGSNTHRLSNAMLIMIQIFSGVEGSIWFNFDSKLLCWE